MINFKLFFIALLLHFVISCLTVWRAALTVWACVSYCGWTAALTIYIRRRKTAGTCCRETGTWAAVSAVIVDVWWNASEEWFSGVVVHTWSWIKSVVVSVWTSIIVILISVEVWSSIVIIAQNVCAGALMMVWPSIVTVIQIMSLVMTFVVNATADRNKSVNYVFWNVGDLLYHFFTMPTVSAMRTRNNDCFMNAFWWHYVRPLRWWNMLPVWSLWWLPLRSLKWCAVGALSSLIESIFMRRWKLRWSIWRMRCRIETWSSIIITGSLWRCPLCRWSLIKSLYIKCLRCWNKTWRSIIVSVSVRWCPLIRWSLIESSSIWCLRRWNQTLNILIKSTPQRSLTCSISSLRWRLLPVTSFI